MGVAQWTLHFLHSQQGLYLPEFVQEKKKSMLNIFSSYLLWAAPCKTGNRELEEGEHEAHPAVRTVSCVCICRDPLQPQGITTASEYRTVCSG